MAASNACFAAPDRPQSHYAYGEAWLAAGDPARAEQAFAAAIQRAPAWAEAWVSYGLARYRQGAIEDAKTAMRQALLHQPGHRVALANLGAFLRITGEPDAAETLLRRAVEADPDNAGARLNLAADLLQDDLPGDALALLDAAPALPADPPTLCHWQLERARMLLLLDRLAEARSVLAALASVPPALAPLLFWRHVLLAVADGDDAAAQAAAAEMARALDAMGPDAVPEHRIMGHYNLAKFWSGRGDHAAAFAHWMAGHTLLRPLQPFDRGRYLAMIDASIAAFPASRFTAGAVARNTDPAPVFIVGMPRSGTTLCERILAAHGQVHGAGERSALGRLSARIGGADGDVAARRIAAINEGALDAAAQDYLSELHALAPGAARIVDKMPSNYLHLGLVGRMLPGARVIHCVRDPRDVGLSIFTFRFHGYHPYAHDLADLGWTIAQQDRLMAHWKQVLPNPVLTVKLSDWVTDFDGTLARALALLDLPPDPACARFYETTERVRTVSRSQVLQPVNARGLGRWRPYERELQPLIAELERANMLRAWDILSGETNR